MSKTYNDKYTNLKRYEEARDCKNWDCDNKFIIKKKNVKTRYCVECRRQYYKKRTHDNLHKLSEKASHNCSLVTIRKGSKGLCISVRKTYHTHSYSVEKNLEHTDDILKFLRDVKNNLDKDIALIEENLNKN